MTGVNQACLDSKVMLVSIVDMVYDRLNQACLDWKVMLVSIVDMVYDQCKPGLS